MNRRSMIFLGAAAALSACATGAALPPPGGGAAGGPRVYRITPANQNEISFRLLDSVNSLRGARGLGSLAYNSQLNAAAATHSRDMSVQNRPWHFGSDGSSPLVRVQRAGYSGRLVGELISETYETEIETLAAWMNQPDTRAVIMEPTAREIGFSWWQEENGKIWWTLVTGG